MSMITAQIKRLREQAELFREKQHYITTYLDEAADTIEQLAAKVRTENAIPIIKALPSVTPQPCNDVISRQAVLDIVDSYSESQSNVEDVTQDIISDIVALSPVNPQPKTGHWEKTTDDYCYWYKCSCCGTKVPKNEWGSDYFGLYCPECGAKMIEPQESEGTDADFD